MHVFSIAVSLLGVASVTPLGLGLAQSSIALDSYITSEGAIAKAGVLANIGPDGAKSQGAHAGVVIASPSTSDPDYLFTWTRDSSLVFKMLIDQFTTGIDSSLQSKIDAFVSAEATLQQISNPSGSVTSGGLGEPKFNVNLSAFTDPWGRPQRGDIDDHTILVCTLHSFFNRWPGVARDRSHYICELAT